MNFMYISKKLLLAEYLALALFLLTQNVMASEVNIYTSRHYDSDIKLYEEFTRSSGIRVNIISGKGEALIERIKSEGDNTLADVFLTSDAGNLWKVQKEGLFKSISSKYILETVPINFRGENNEWAAIAKRARVIFFNPKRVSINEVENLSYEDLSKKAWRNRIAIRSSNNIYNQSLVASLISKNGLENTEKWAKALVSNFARKPQGNDRSQIIAVANGEADIAIANSYYFGLMLSGEKGADQLNAASKVSMHFPNQNNSGTHVNISGAGIIRNANNPENGELFIEFLLSEKAQKHIVNNTFEYPILETVSPSSYISKFGTDFIEDKTPASDFGKFNSEAIRLMDRVGWK